MRNVTGQVVRAGDFFDRENTIRHFWQNLETDNLLLLAPRRVGKSSLMQKMDVEAPTHGFSSIFVDVSDCVDELRFMQRVLTNVLRKHGTAERLWHGLKESWAGRTFGRVESVGVTGIFDFKLSEQDFEWAQVGQDLAKALSGLDDKTLIQIDELPVFLLKLLGKDNPSGQGRVREFLYWMRMVRQTFPHVRWLLAGSIGLDTIASRLNIADSINDLSIVSLGAFDRPTSHRFLQELATTYNIDLREPVRDHMLDRIGWLIPFYQQLLFNELRQQTEYSVEHVDRAMNELLEPHNRVRFIFWRQRLEDELGRTDADLAAAMLHPASRSPQGVRRAVFSQTLSRWIGDADTREDKVRYLLDVLQNDGYLVETDGYWQFRSPLLREFWQRRIAPPEVTE